MRAPVPGLGSASVLSASHRPAARLPTTDPIAGGFEEFLRERIIEGLDDGPRGQAGRLVREMGGFVRFAPLPGGTLETRVFLPAS